jgi:hypothetical protein
MKQAAGFGGATGAVAGAGAAPTVEDIPMSALIGGGVGMGAGMGLQAALSAGGALGSGALNMIAGRFAPEAVGRAGARANVRQMIARSGTTTEEALHELARQEQMRPGLAVPADVHPLLAESLRKAGRQGVTDPDVVQLVSRVRNRVLGAAERLTDDLDDLTGFGGKTRVEAQAANQARLDRLGDELYGELRAQPGFFQDPELTTFLDRPDVAGVWRRLRPIAGKDEPGFREFHNLRRRLYGEGRAAERAGNTELMRDMYQHAEELTDILERMSPGFKAANREFAQTAQTVSAFDRGARALRRNIGEEGVQAELADIASRAGPQADDAIEAFRRGAVDELQQQMLNMPEGINVGGKIQAMSPRREAVVRSLFDTPEEFMDFMERATIENGFHELKRMSIGDPALAEAGSDLLRSARTSVFWSKMAAVLNYISKGSPRVSEAQRNEYVRLLLTPGQRGADQLRDAMGRGILGLPRLQLPFAPEVALPVAAAVPSATAVRLPQLLGPREPELERRQP